MTGHQTLVNRAILRAAVGLLTAAAMVLVAPVAAATPETDANDAINQVWDSQRRPHRSTRAQGRRCLPRW